MNEKLPFWRNPVLILVFVLPAISIIAGVGLLVTALRTGGDDPVLDEVRRTARAQTTDLGADEAARVGRFAAVVRVDPENGAVEVLPVSGRFTRSTPLRLVLSHPVRAAEDLRLELAPTETGWRVAAEVDTSHDWNLRLSPADGEWRLQGRLLRDQLAARLQPALQDASDDP